MFFCVYLLFNELTFEKLIPKKKKKKIFLKKNIIIKIKAFSKIFG